MPYRILHVADVHLDAAFVGADAAIGRQRREQLRTAFERALRIARDQRVDAVCIAGDLYEDGRAGSDRTAYLRRVLGDLAPIRVFLSPGNHDPFTGASIYQRMAPLPDNVFIFSRRRFTSVPLADDITLWGFAHEHKLDRDPAIGDFVCTGPGTHLLLFHGSDRDHMPPEKEAVAPFSGIDIERAGAQHAMLGHFHGLMQGPRHAYPGSLEPLNPAQSGRHTASLVTIADGRVGIEFLDINQVRYADIAFDISPFGDRAELQSALSTRLGEAASANGTIYFRVQLVGAAQPTLDLDANALASDLDAAFGGTRVIDDSAAFDFGAVAHEGRTVRSEFVREMRGRIAAAPPAQRAQLEDTLRYGMLAFARRQIQL